MIWVRADLTWVAASAQRPLRVTFLRIVTLAVTGTRKLFRLGSARRERLCVRIFRIPPGDFKTGRTVMREGNDALSDARWCQALGHIGERAALTFYP